MRKEENNSWLDLNHTYTHNNNRQHKHTHTQEGGTEEGESHLVVVCGMSFVLKMLLNFIISFIDFGRI